MIPRTEAYWLSPHSKIIPVKMKHIRTILDEPETFGLSREFVMGEFDQFHEKYGFEGFAREAIMLDLLRRGWIRVRFLPKYFIWRFQIWCLREKEFLLLRNLVGEIKLNEPSGICDEVLLLITKCQVKFECGFRDFTVDGGWDRFKLLGRKLKSL